MSAAAPLGQVQETLAVAQDEKICQVVALVDAMGTRGDADALIAPLRARLSQLRPPRPPKLGRLLYLPLDPLIVPNNAWAPGMLALPRSLLPLLTAVIERELGARTAGLHEAARRLPAGDAFAVRSLGGMLWPEGARILAATPPLTLDEAGVPSLGVALPKLTLAEAGSLALATAALLAQGTTLADIAQRARLGTPPGMPELKALLQVALTKGALPFALMLLLLLRQYPRAPGLIGLAEHLADQSGLTGAKQLIEQIADRTIAVIGEECVAGIGAIEPARIAGEIDRVLGLLQTLERSAAGGAGGRRARLGELRREFDAHCQVRFRALLTTSLIAGVRALADPVRDDDVGALETVARDLRRFEQSAKELGDGGVYQALLASAAGQVQGGTGGLSLNERVRLVEILIGPEEAMALLGSD